MDWREISGNWVLMPSRPTAIVHFLGGAFVATTPQITYRGLLEHLSQKNYAVIATPFVSTLDHRAIAKQALQDFESTLKSLYNQGTLRNRLPTYGLGHSMGCKLHLLIGSLFPVGRVERAGNVLASFNNYAARDAIPLVEQFSSAFSSAFSSTLDVEFTPSPLETNAIVAQRYQIPRNLLVKFDDDNLDQTLTMDSILQKRFPGMVTLHRQPGNHLTPLGQTITWQAGSSFTPLDAIGQWMKQGVYQNINQLKSTILHWLDPLALR